MIALLRGRVAAVSEDAAVVDVGGVGYLVHCAPATLQRFPRIGEAVEVHTEFQVRTDSMQLFGFLDPAERTWFRLLQTVQGVGARVALSVLGTLPPGPLSTAIVAGDKAAISRANGVGGKLAARIVAELKDRVGTAATAISLGVPPVATADGAAAEALSALVNLGYARSEAFAAVGRVQARLGEGAAVDAVLRESLRELSP